MALQGWLTGLGSESQVERVRPGATTSTRRAEESANLTLMAIRPRRLVAPLRAPLRLLVATVALIDRRRIVGRDAAGHACFGGASHDHVGVLGETIEPRRRELVVAEHVAPLAEGEVGGDHRGAARGQHLEEQTAQWAPSERSLRLLTPPAA